MLPSGIYYQSESINGPQPAYYNNTQVTANYNYGADTVTFPVYYVTYFSASGNTYSCIGQHPAFAILPYTSKLYFILVPYITNGASQPKMVRCNTPRGITTTVVKNY